jgi:ATP-dependent helicase HrpB
VVEGAVRPLPVDAILPDVVSALRRGRSLVVEAPPGAGKTTRIPPALLAAGLAGTGEVVVLEPRRLAARMAARRVAEELGERPGQTVGWQVRFEEVSGPDTRLRYVTEGLLTRRLIADPGLPGVGAVVLDEFHERHLQGDLALALLRRIQETSRPDLKLVVMSATLDAGPVAHYLDAPSLRSEGRLFEVAVEHLSPADAAKDERLEDRVASAVRRLVNEAPDGDVLVFLPGMAEIRRAAQACAPLANRAGLDVLPLHGDLSPEEQDRAVRPGPRRKVILSTNVAETSVTIEGVTAVVDSGLARVASHSPWSGLPRLEVRRVSKASATQRAGRAGRTAPGRCLRLYTRHDLDTRPEFDLPEILREDLSETLLSVASLGLGGLEWLDPPPPAAAEAATTLLRALGALAPDGAISPLGRRLLRFPLHPRLARLVVEADLRGAGSAGALLAALLAERDIRERAPDRGRGTPPTGPSDLLELAHLFEEASRARFDPGRVRSAGLSPGALQAVDRSQRQIVQLLGRGRARTAAEASEDALLLATLAAYPDRVARRRAPGSAEVVFAGGGSARLDEASVVRDAPFLVAVDADERRDRRVPGAGPASGRAGVLVRIASVVTPEMLLELFPDELRWEEELTWNAEAERVDAFERMRYRDLVLEESRVPVPDAGRAAALLAEAALARGARSFGEEGEIDRLLARIAFASRAAPESGIVAPGEDDVAAALREACEGRRSFAELREAGIGQALLGRLPPDRRALLERLAPERIALAGGRGLRVHYEVGDKPPWVESRLQDFFGSVRGPTVGAGRVPLVLHLLAPNMRAVQVTTDLAGFWERHYPALRRELMRRYPRHAWPEDPRSAVPPEPRGRR